MTEQEIHGKLALAKVKVTPVRSLIVKTIASSNAPMSAKDIEDALETVDRSYITRTLGLLHSKDIIHAVEDGSGSVKYEMCEAHGSHFFGDQHPHFHCVRCGKTECLYHVKVRMSPLPVGYKAHSSNFILTGLCANCNDLI